VKAFLYLCCLRCVCVCVCVCISGSFTYMHILSSLAQIHTHTQTQQKKPIDTHTHTHTINILSLVKTAFLFDIEIPLKEFLNNQGHIEWKQKLAGRLRHMRNSPRPRGRASEREVSLSLSLFHTVKKIYNIYIDGFYRRSERVLDEERSNCGQDSIV